MERNRCRDIFIRGFTLNDMNEIMQIENECFDPSARYSEEVFRYYCWRDSLFKVAECNGVVVGYVIADVEDSFCHVVSIAVRRAYRRMGIGSALLNHVLAECKKLGAKRAYLEVATGNQPALEMYFKAGFQIIGVIKNYYGVEDAYVMVKDLNLRD